MNLSISGQESADLEMFRFFEMTPDLVCIAGKEGYFKRVNQSVINKFGYSKEELFSRPISDLIHPEDRELTQSRRQELLEGKTLIDFQNRYISKDGTVIWLHWTSVYIAEKEVVFAIAKDVTERRLKEKEIEEKYRQFESLASHFKARLERDKKHVATELHEDLAQMASAVKMNLSWLKENDDADGTAREDRIEESLMLMDMLIDSIRTLSYSISPNMLDDLGLNDTLHWLCEQFSLVNRIPCHFEGRLEDANTLSREIQLDLFRICQESLSNVIHHADADAVWVTLDMIEGKVSLSVTDNGKGFRADETVGSGVDNMRKIAASVAGELIIESDIGKGTRVTVVIAADF